MKDNTKSQLGLTLALTSLLGACAGQEGLLQPPSNRLSIESEPPGAEIWIMGERSGTTPAKVPVARVFPQVYDPQDRTLYGKVRLVKDGCEARTLTVGTGAVSSGIRATLDCAASTAAEPESGSPPAAARVQSHPKSARSRLVQLKELRRDGLISEQEYRQLRQRVLDAL